MNNYPDPFKQKVIELAAKARSDMPTYGTMLLEARSKKMADCLKLLSTTPGAEFVIECLDSNKYNELRAEAELGVKAKELYDELIKNWRSWCPNDPPGNFRASAFCPEGELVGT